MLKAVDAKHLVRLRNEYEARARQLKASGNTLEARVTQMQARTLGACAQDINDLINGLEHPSGRRG